MALKLWAQLDGSTIDKVNRYSLSGSPASWGNGKTGKCATFNNNAGYKIYRTTTGYNYTTQDFSWCMWINKNASGATTQMYAFTVGRADAGGYGYGVRVKSSTELECRFGNSAWTVSGIADNTWYHVAFVRKGTAISIYVNGTVNRTVTFSGTTPTYSDGNGLGIGCFYYASGSIYPLTGSICDFRIYDHALSAKEVKEISMALILHYSLGNIYTIGVLNKYSGDAARGYCRLGGFARTKLAGEDGYKYTLNYTGTGSNNWPSFGAGLLDKANFTAGKTYTWSCKYRVNQCTAGSVTMRNACWNNDYSNGGVTIADASKVDGQWHVASRTFTITQSIYDNTSFAPEVQFYCSNLNGSGTVYQMDIDIKEIQIIEADKYVGWVFNDYVSTDIPDESGFGHTGTRSTTTPPSLMTSSPRHSTAWYFNTASLARDTDTYISFQVETALSTVSLSFWAYIPSSLSNSHKTITSKKDDPDDNLWLTLNNGDSGVWACWDGVFHKKEGTMLSTDTWHHIVFTFDAGATKSYVDGSLVHSTNELASVSTTWPNDIRAIGNSFPGFPGFWDRTAFAGGISDFRMYGTVLSAEDVAELYHTAVSFTRNGEIHAYDIIEDGNTANPEILKTGVVKTKAISENYGRYDNSIRIEPDGSSWIRMVHHADPTSYLFSSSDSFATSVYRDSRRWFHGKICDYTSRWEFMIVQKADSSANILKYRWLQTKNPNTAAWAEVAASAITKNTSSGYSNFSTGGLYKINSNTFYCTNNGTQGNWWGAVGAWNSHQGGIPAWGNVIVKDGGYLDLYIRIDGGATWSWPENDRVSIVKPDKSITAYEIVEN